MTLSERRVRQLHARLLPARTVSRGTEASPHAVVIGVDRSEHRLQRAQALGWKLRPWDWYGKLLDAGSRTEAAAARRLY